MKHSPLALAEHLAVRCAELGIAIDPPAALRLVLLLEAIAVEPQNLTSVVDPAVGLERHLVDSLAGLALGPVSAASRLVDIGSGAGFPGLAIAIARPALAVTLVESERRKAEWLARAAEGCPNVAVRHERAELTGRSCGESFDVVTARALGPLPVVLELAAPLLAPGGTLVAWRGRRDADEEARAAAAAEQLGLDVGPVSGVDNADGHARHLHEFRRTGIVPERFPRRPGLASKRPLA